MTIRLIFSFAAMAVSACSSVPEAKATWWDVCPDSALRVTENGNTLKTYSSGCHVSDKEPAEQVSIRRFTAELPSNDDAYFDGDGMRWINPDRADYAERTAGLTKAVFPFESLSDCRAAKACQ